MRVRISALTSTDVAGGALNVWKNGDQCSLTYFLSEKLAAWRGQLSVPPVTTASNCVSDLSGGDECPASSWLRYGRGSGPSLRGEANVSRIPN